MGLPWWPIGKEPTCNAGEAGDTGWIPESRRTPEEGHGNPLQYSFLENPIDRGYSPWGHCGWAGVHRATKSWTELKQLSTQYSLSCTRDIPSIKGFLLF